MHLGRVRMCLGHHKDLAAQNPSLNASIAALRNHALLHHEIVGGHHSLNTPRYIWPAGSSSITSATAIGQADVTPVTSEQDIHDARVLVAKSLEEIYESFHDLNKPCQHLVEASIDFFRGGDVDDKKHRESLWEWAERRLPFMKSFYSIAAQEHMMTGGQADEFPVLTTTESRAHPSTSSLTNEPTSLATSERSRFIFEEGVWVPIFEDWGVWYPLLL